MQQAMPVKVNGVTEKYPVKFEFGNFTTGKISIARHMSTYLLKKHDKGKHQPIQQCDIGRVAPNFVSRPNAQSIIF